METNTPPQVSPAPQKPQNKKVQYIALAKEIAIYVVIALVVVLPIRIYIAQPFIVSGLSMFPTFNNGQYLIIDELSYDFHAPQRGDIVIFKYPLNTSEDFIKRIIGLPGETVDIENGKVIITNAAHPQGFALNETYPNGPTYDYGNGKVTLGPNQYFVMGDNRLVSSDSRIWGPVPRADIIGTPILRLLPISAMAIDPGKVASSTIENQASTTVKNQILQ